MSKIIEATQQVGWVITNTDPGSEDRIGYGQCTAETKATIESHDAVVGRTIYMRRGLSHTAIPEDKRVRWRSYSDDGDPAYEGYIHFDWLFNPENVGFEDGEDPGYELDRFCMEDWGAVIVLYNGNDIKRCDPEKREFVERNQGHRNDGAMKNLGQHWFGIYG